MSNLYGNCCAVEYEYVVVITYWYKSLTISFIVCLRLVMIKMNYQKNLMARLGVSVGVLLAASVTLGVGRSTFYITLRKYNFTYKNLTLYVHTE